SAPFGSASSTSAGSRWIDQVVAVNVSGTRRVMSPDRERSLRIWLPLTGIWTRTLGGLCTSARPRGSSTLSVTSTLVVTGCWSCTATYNISARNSAAPLIGQLRVMSCSRLLFIQQPPDEHFVDRILPICGPDDAFHDHTVTIDQVTLRHSENVVRLPDLATGIVQDIECETQGARERHDFLRPRLFLRVERVAVDADRGDAEVGAGEFLVQAFHRRHFRAAGRAPRRPDVEQHHLASIIGDGRRLVRAQIRGGEIRRARPDLHRVELGPQLDRERDAEHGRHHDAGDQRPLLTVRHTVTMQRRRSSRTSRPGSPLAKTALPATNVSAPAWCAAAMVCFVIPPSTSRKNCVWCVVRSAW